MSQIDHLDSALDHLAKAGAFEASVYTGTLYGPNRIILQGLALNALRQAYKQVKSIRSAYAKQSLAMRQK